MAAKITFFNVGNGDMTLIRLESGRTILIDVRIRAAADDQDDDETRDVAKDLRDRLVRDKEGRLYVDAYLQGHPDADHCTGLQEHLHIGSPEDFNKKDDKIFIREIWSSPIVFRRADKTLKLCDDAKAFWTEARRRVKRYRDSKGDVGEGDRILILGEDQDGKTDDLTAILIKVDQIITKVNGTVDSSFSAYLLGPLPKATDESEEDALAKNRSSVILQMTIASGGVSDACLFLTGGDAEVAIWERQWKKHQKKPGVLEYDLLQAPHHCSWRSLSYDSWSMLREKAKVNAEARKALGQARKGATIVASSDPIKDDDNDPPCIRAKREYEEVVKEPKGEFICVGEHPTSDDPEPLEFEITKDGTTRKLKRMNAPAIITGAIGGQPLRHG